MDNPYFLKGTDGEYYNKYPEFQIWEEACEATLKEVVECFRSEFSFWTTDDKFRLFDFCANPKAALAEHREKHELFLDGRS